MAKKSSSKSKVIYHGTSEEIAKMSLVFGLNKYEVSSSDCGKPRMLPGSTKSGIVLTDCYSGFMANETASMRDKWGILEIDVSFLEQKSFFPHELFLLEKSKKKNINLNEFLENSMSLRKKISSNSQLWKESLDSLGFFVYGNNIPAKAITKVIVFDWKTNWMVTREAISIGISSRHHLVQKERQKIINKWISCNFVEPKDWCENYDKVSAKERETISNFIFNKSGLDIYYQK